MGPIKLALSYNDVLLVPQYSEISSRGEVDLSTQIAPDITLKIPLIAANMDTVTGVEMAVSMHKLGGMAFIGRFDPPNIQANKVAKIKKKGAESIGVIGVKDDYLKRAEMLLKAGSIALHLDIAHAHSAHGVKVIRDVKKAYPKVTLIAGTVASYKGAFDLLEAGADSLKVGIGAGSICITRIATGHGVPEITAVMEAIRAKNKFKNRFIIADGGASNSGDIVKVLAAGASAYEGGSLFAGTDETPGTIIRKNGIFYKEYNGSTSPEEKVRQLKKDSTNKKPHYSIHVEGVEAMVKYKGPLSEVVDSLTAGIRSGYSYSGAKNIKELWRKAQFIQITGAGYRESQSHDVILR